MCITYTMAESWILASYLLFQSLVVLMETTWICSWIQYQGAWNMNGNCVNWSRESTFPLLLLYLLVYIFMDFLGIFVKLQKSNCYLHHVCLSIQPYVHMQQLSSYGTDFHEIWYLSIFLKSFKKIQIPLK